MASRIEPSGRSVELAPQPKVGDVLEHGIVMRVKRIPAMDFIMHNIAGGLPLYGHSQILVDEHLLEVSICK